MTGQSIRQSNKDRSGGITAQLTLELGSSADSLRFPEFSRLTTSYVEQTLSIRTCELLFSRASLRGLGGEGKRWGPKSRGIWGSPQTVTRFLICLTRAMSHRVMAHDN